MSVEGFLQSDYSPTIMSGQFESTYGTKMGFTLGSSLDHTFGTESKLFCDPAGLLPANPVLALLWGASGKTDFVFGGGTSVKYAGREFSISRNPARWKTSEFDFSTPEQAVLSASKAKLSLIDMPVAEAVAALSVLMCAISLALDLSLHFRYPKFGSEEESDKETIDGYGLSPKLIKGFSAMLVSRLMAVIRYIEVTADHTERAEQAAEDGAADAEQGAGSLVGAEPVPIITVTNTEGVTETVEEVESELAAAATEQPPLPAD